MAFSLKPKSTTKSISSDRCFCHKDGVQAKHLKQLPTLDMIRFLVTCLGIGKMGRLALTTVAATKVIQQKISLSVLKKEES